MVEVYGFWGEIKEVRGDLALFEFSHPSEQGKQKMWVKAEDVGIVPTPEPLPPIEYTGGGIIACHPCGNAHEECECP